MSAKPKVEPPTLAEVINLSKTAAWNSCITPRLESLRAFFLQPEWQKGIGSYLNTVLAKQLQTLITGCKDRDADQFARGYIAATQDIIGFPEAIERQIASIEQQKKDADQRGPAGY